MIAEQFVYNPMATIDDVVTAYRLFLRREPEEKGLRHYEQYVAQGMTRDRLLDIFLTSAEFALHRKSHIVAVDLGGYEVCIDPKETDIGQWLVINGDYEPHVRDAIRERLRPGQTFVDLGANVGCISLLAAKIVGPDGLVIAVEPNPMNQQRLYAGIVRNGFTNVRVMPYAVSDRRTTLSITGGTSNTYVVDAMDIEQNGTYAQTLIPDEDLAYLRSIDMIKMDVEGHESFALRGFTTLIRKHDPTMMAEFCPFSHTSKGLDPMEYLEILFSLYKNMTATTIFGDWEVLSGPQELMEYWRKRDKELSEAGMVTEGVLHLDLIATNR